jgi:hypothetical protein
MVPRSFLMYRLTVLFTALALTPLVQAADLTIKIPGGEALTDKALAVDVLGALPGENVRVRADGVVFGKARVDSFGTAQVVGMAPAGITDGQVVLFDAMSVSGLLSDPTEVLFRNFSLMLEAEYENGHSQGFEDGNNEGFSLGHEEGFEEGFDFGWIEGEAKGYTTGFDEGWDEGHDKGYTVGFQEGEATCIIGPPPPLDFHSHQPTMGSVAVTLTPITNTEYLIEYSTLEYLAGFQFSTDEPNILSAYDGTAAQAGFILSTAPHMLQAYTFTGALIEPADPYNKLVFIETSDKVTCLADIVITGEAGVSLDVVNYAPCTP